MNCVPYAMNKFSMPCRHLVLSVPSEVDTMYRDKGK